MYLTQSALNSPNQVLQSALIVVTDTNECHEMLNIS